jgi:hypothetical protein
MSMRYFVLVALTALSLAAPIGPAANAAPVSESQGTYHVGQSGSTGFSPGFTPQAGDGGWG